MRPPILAPLLTLVLSACGYAAMTSADDGATPAVRLGRVDDLSAEGDLGVRVRRHLARSLPGGPDPSHPAPPVLTGAVRTVDEGPAGFDRAGIASLYALAVELELRVVDPAGRVTWTTGPLRRRATFARGPSPIETAAARRAAVERALRRVADDALLALRADPPEAAP